MTKPDHNYRSISDVDGYVLNAERIDPRQEDMSPRSFDDVLKFSHARNIFARGLWVAGGRENAIDMNRACQNIQIEDSSLECGNQCAIAIKGGSMDITLRRVLLIAARGVYDIEIGGWSDQSYAPTTGIRLVDVQRSDGQPVRVVVGRGDWPTVVGGNVKILRFKSYLLKAFWWAKFIVVRWVLKRRPILIHP